MRIHRNALLLLIVALVVLGMGIAAFVSAQNSPSAPAAVETEDDEAADDREDDGGEVERPASASDATLTEDEAVALAEAETGSSAVFVELEHEGGAVIYSIELEDGSEIEIDANSGDIVEFEEAGSDSD